MDTTVDVKTPPSRHYFYRKVSQPDQSSSQNNVLLNSAESANIFENRVADFVNKSSMQSAIANLRTEATQDLNRRKADRRARKEREEQLLHHSTNNHSSTHSLETPTDVKHEDSITTFDKILFEKLNTLTPNEQNAWLANTNDNSLLVNPHQWLKLASLFNVNSKVARQQTLLNIASSESVLQDRSITKEEVKPLENFLELRDIQNRNYARDAVAEGVKFFKQNRVKDAMEFYKRALDMDPKYADGWFHVAEGLVQQKKLTDAAEQLERALKLDPTHEEAKALLASVRHTLAPTKPTKGDEWELVDEFGDSLENSESVKSKRRDESDDESRLRRKKKKSSRRSRSRETETSSRRRDRSSRRSRSRETESSSRRRDRESRRRSRSKEKRDSPRRRDRRSRSRDAVETSRRRDRRSRSRDAVESSRRKDKRPRSRDPVDSSRTRDSVDSSRGRDRRPRSRDAADSSRRRDRRSRSRDAVDSSRRRDRRSRSRDPVDSSRSRRDGERDRERERRQDRERYRGSAVRQK